jgi:membrane-bound serine protease (ClpP class)
MDFLLDPNIAYLLLTGGLALALLALLSPGTGLLEIAALFTLLLAGFALYNLPINPAGLAIVAAGVGLYVYAVFRARGQWAFLVISLLVIMAGSVYLFGGESWYQPSVNPALAAVVSIFWGTFFFIATRKIMEARLVQPTHDLKSLIGEIGEAKTDIQSEGSVQVAGERWSAWSQNRIPVGTMVRVVRREGFILEVEPVDQGS